MKRHAHAWLGLLEGSFLLAMGILFLKSTHVAVGGITGVALIADWSMDRFTFGQIYLVINLPFYWLAYREKGAVFTARTAIAVTLIGVFTDLLTQHIDLQLGSPILGALGGGALVGFGIVTLFQHNASTGGFTVLVLWLERRWQVNRGFALLAIDAMTIGAALWMFGAEMWLSSFLVTVVMGSIIGRYKPQNPQPQLKKNLDAPIAMPVATQVAASGTSSIKAGLTLPVNKTA